MASTTKTNLYVNIKELPIISDVNNGDFLILETDVGTSIIDFQDFLITLDNTTFKSTFNTMQTDVQTLVTPSVVVISSDITLSDTYHNQVIVANNSINISVILPANLKQGFKCTVIRNGNGTVSISSVPGIITKSYNNYITIVNNSSVDIQWIGDNTFNISPPSSLEESLTF
jgi:hypothetical protein